MSELHHRQPKQMPQKEPGQKTLTETLLCERQREEIYDTWLLNSVVSYYVLIHATMTARACSCNHTHLVSLGRSCWMAFPPSSPASLLSALSSESLIYHKLSWQKSKVTVGQPQTEFFDSYLLHKWGFQSRIFPRDDDNVKINCLLLQKKIIFVCLSIFATEFSINHTFRMRKCFFFLSNGFSLRNMQKWFFKRSIFFY